MSRLGVLAIEGVPGAGKSTVATLLAARFGAQRVELSQEFRRLRRDAALDDADPLTQLLYYLAATSHMSAAFAELRPVIVDRWVPSVLGLVEAGGGLTRQRLARIVTPVVAELPSPAATVLLAAAPDVAQARIARRTKPELHTTAAHRIAATDTAFLDGWQRAIRHWCDQLGVLHEIDTTTLAAGEVAKAVADIWLAAPTGGAPDR